MKKASKGRTSLAERYTRKVKKESVETEQDITSDDEEDMKATRSKQNSQGGTKQTKGDTEIPQSATRSFSGSKGKSRVNLLLPSRTVTEDDEQSYSSARDDDDDDDGDKEFHGASDRFLNLADQIAKDDDSGKRAPRRRVTQGGREVENRFAAQPKTSVSLADLLGDDQGEGKGQLKRRLEKLSSDRIQTITPTVSKAEQERADRKVGYEQAVNKLDNWEGIVLNNRKVKLSFPLNEKSASERPSIRNILPKASSAAAEPRTSLEKEIAEALAASGLASEKDVLKSEQNALKDLPDQEEAKKRHAELAKMRALMFYSEQKAKRIKKIKSKTFRKLRKKRLSREEEKALEKLRETDPEAAREHEEKLALRRAQERMSLRQKNTSKNMRELAKRHKFDDQSTELRRKMRSIGGGDNDDDDDDDESDEEGDGNDVEGLARKHLEQVEQELDEKQNEDAKGIFALQFMKRGMQREREQALRQAKDLVGNLTGEGEAEDKVEAQLGKRSFGGGSLALQQPKGGGRTLDAAPLFEAPEFSSGEEDDEDEHKEQLTEREGKTEAKKEQSVPQANAVQTKATSQLVVSDDKQNYASEEEETNPWLVPEVSSARNKQRVDVEGIAVSKVLEKISSTSNGATSKKRKASQEAVDAELSEDRTDDELDQQALVRRAFADVVLQDFAAEQQQLEEEKRKAEEQPGKVAGWGTWAGLGVPDAPRPVKKLKAGQHTSNATPKSNVIVSTRTNKLQKKYQVDQVPYPFTSREQYERSLLEPVGPEWNTTKQFQKKIQPDVTVKVGAIIQPLKYSKSVSSSTTSAAKKKAVLNRKKL